MSLTEITVVLAVIALLGFVGVDRWTAATRTAAFERDLKELAVATQAYHRTHCANTGFGVDRTAAEVGADLGPGNDWTVTWPGSADYPVLRYGGTDKHRQRFLLARGGVLAGTAVEIRPVVPSIPGNREQVRIRRILWGNTKC